MSPPQLLVIIEGVHHRLTYFMSNLPDVPGFPPSRQTLIARCNTIVTMLRRNNHIWTVILVTHNLVLNIYQEFITNSNHWL